MEPECIPPVRSSEETKVTRRQVIGKGLVGIAALSAGEVPADAAPPAGRRLVGAGDWPMARGGLLRANRAAIKGKIDAPPVEAWRHEIGRPAETVIRADLDEDGIAEIYAAENGRIVK